MTPSDLFEFITPEGYGIFAELDANGVVSFIILAGEGSPVRGTEMFNRMMSHFGDRVRAVRGVWRTNNRGERSTNIEKVNELTGRGERLEEAVRYAWTATRAAKLGFCEVRLEGPPEGVPGAYTKVNVLIEKRPPDEG